MDRRATLVYLLIGAIILAAFVVLVYTERSEAPFAQKTNDATAGWHEHDGEWHTHEDGEYTEGAHPALDDYYAVRAQSIVTDRITVKDCNEIDPSVARASASRPLFFVNDDPDSAHTIELFLGPGEGKARKIAMAPKSETTVEFEQQGRSTYGCDGIPLAATIIVDP